ncbi:type II toxin-antitoxin system prevent-host-death family antitoxin [Actinoplanes solisilvae]|uniref:type II toxin-antitoxin system prevent-host-death family antitoxin n=1 Tax=Actinoplanes solisilvae TaxID=2486853 RepID=UPI000FD8F59D|nr:type II toxin-antitoxin system prevent-host-death family antitoxin [Actinoplanes solisilvae]
MAIEATKPPPVRIELSINEARTRFLQLLRLTRVTHQTTVIVDRGEPVAAIVPPEALERAGPQAFDRSSPSANPSPSQSANPNPSAAGWLQRLERVRDDLRRQHATRTDELLHALDEAWRTIDTLRPPGTDRHVDTLRAAHAPLRRPDR